MRWWRRREERSTSYSIADPVLAEYFGVGPMSYAGVQVGEVSALSVSAVYRAVSLIAGTIAGLPMRTLRDVEGIRTRVGSFLDDPNPNTQTKYEWMETILLHLLLHGNAFLAHVYNQGGGLIGLVPIHPLSVTVELERVNNKFTGFKEYKASFEDGTQRTFTDATMTHIPGLSLDGIRGLSPIAIARNSLGTAIAGERAAAKMFSNGALISGILTPEDDLSEDEAKVIKDSLNRKVAGWDNAGEIAVINRKLKFSPWTMSMEDAQFLESRQFQVEEIARWYGVPPHLLMQTEKQTSWGTGVSEQNRGLARFSLTTWTHRVEKRLSRLLPEPRFVEIDFAGLERGTPSEEIDLLLKQINSGLMTVNEARRIRNLDPIEGGDAIRTPSFSAPVDDIPVGA